jgi:hypothetical protein
VAAFAIYTFGWHDHGSNGRTAPVGRSGHRVYTLSEGDVVRIPAAAARCEVTEEGSIPNFYCAHLGQTGYQVVLWKDQADLYDLARHGEPMVPTYSVPGVLKAASAADSASAPIVRADGRIGSFRIDRTSEAQLRAMAGEPNKVGKQYFPPQKTPLGRTLYYQCGRGCETAYSIRISTGRLSDYWSTSPRFVTVRGSSVGMSGAQAARREGKKLVPGCGDPLYIHLRWDAHHQFVLTVAHGKVHSVGYLGPHSVYYEGLC